MSLVKTLIGATVAVSVVFLVVGLLAKRALADEGQQICFHRSGESGILNISPVTIQVEDSGVLKIVGEEEVCLRVRSAFPDNKAAITLRFPYPYNDQRPPRFWQTQPVFVAIKAGTVTRITLCPRIQDRNDPHWANSGWHEMWVLSPPENAAACGPEYVK